MIARQVLSGLVKTVTLTRSAAVTPLVTVTVFVPTRLVLVTRKQIQITQHSLGKVQLAATKSTVVTMLAQVTRFVWEHNQEEVAVAIQVSTQDGRVMVLVKRMSALITVRMVELVQ